MESHMICVQTSFVQRALPERDGNSVDVKNEDAEPTQSRLDTQLVATLGSVEKAEAELALDGLPRDFLHIAHGSIEFPCGLKIANIDPASEGVREFLVLASQFGALACAQTLKECFPALGMVQEPMASELAAMVPPDDARPLNGAGV